MSQARLPCVHPWITDAVFTAVNMLQHLDSTTRRRLFRRNNSLLMLNFLNIVYCRTPTATWDVTGVSNLGTPSCVYSE